MCLIPRTINPAEAHTKCKPNEVLQKALQTNKLSTPAKHVFMLQQCPFLHVKYIPTSRVSIPNDVRPHDAMWLHNLYYVKITPYYLISNVISVTKIRDPVGVPSLQPTSKNKILENTRVESAQNQQENFQNNQIILLCQPIKFHRHHNQYPTDTGTSDT